MADKKPAPRKVIVCPACGASLALDARHVDPAVPIGHVEILPPPERATAADIDALPLEEVKALRSARAKVVRPKRKQ